MSGRDIEEVYLMDSFYLLISSLDILCPVEDIVP